MSTSIFIKTCLKDLEWLEYCLWSIWKFAHGIREVVVVADESCVGRMHVALTMNNAKLYFVDDWPNGYIQQQYVKLHADQYTNADQILFVDSDCVFTTPFNPWSFMRDDKPVLLKTRYGNLGGAEAWKGITEKFVGWSVEWEWMRQMPLMYWKDSITAFRNAHHDKIQAMNRMTTREFSEFNALGAFIDRYESDRYSISDTLEWMPEKFAKQFWSWGGITPEIREEIEEMLK